MLVLDVLGSACSMVSTYYFIQQNNKAWIVGALATIINTILYGYKGIYADMSLEIFYFFTMIYGWITWRYKSTHHNGTVLRLNQLTTFHWLLILASLGLIYSGVFYILTHYTHSSVAFLDATTTSLSIVAQWLMCYKVILTWVLWFITDILYSLMYLEKQLPFHAMLMIFYTILAVTGYLLWSRPTKQTLKPS